MQNRRFSLLALELLFCTSLFGICSQRANDSYRLQLSDTIDVHYPYSPEFDESASLALDGTVTLKQTGSLHLVGLTVQQAQDMIRQNVIRLRDPQVVVSIKDAEKPHFFVGGQVGNPGKFDLRGKITMAEAIAQAGGFNSNARQKQVLLIREVSDGLGETHVVNISRSPSDRRPVDDPQVCAGDFVFVPQNRISKIERYIKLTNIGFFLSPADF